MPSSSLQYLLEEDACSEYDQPGFYEILCPHSFHKPFRDTDYIADKKPDNKGKDNVFQSVIVDGGITGKELGKIG